MDGSYPEAVHDSGDTDRLPPAVERVLEAVEQIPAGCVLSYGDVSGLAGVPGARQVGRIMATYGGLVPWWRVVRADGTLPEGLRERAFERYRREGTPLTDVGVDMGGARWRRPAG